MVFPEAANGNGTKPTEKETAVQTSFFDQFPELLTNEELLARLEGELPMFSSDGSNAGPRWMKEALDDV